MIGSFLCTLQEAVNQGHKSHSWPSGHKVDISALKLCSFQSMAVPHMLTHALAQDFANWRAQLMHFLPWRAPREQQTPVDVIINERRIQEKLGHVRGERVVFYLTKMQTTAHMTLMTLMYLLDTFQAKI